MRRQQSAAQVSSTRNRARERREGLEEAREGGRKGCEKGEKEEVCFPAALESPEQTPP